MWPRCCVHVAVVAAFVAVRDTRPTVHTVLFGPVPGVLVSVHVEVAALLWRLASAAGSIAVIGAAGYTAVVGWFLAFSPLRVMPAPR